MFVKNATGSWNLVPLPNGNNDFPLNRLFFGLFFLEVGLRILLVSVVLVAVSVFLEVPLRTGL